MKMMVRESVTKSLVSIGESNNLRRRIGGRIFHALTECPPDGLCIVDPSASCQLNDAEKEAIAQGKLLKVSWAELGSKQSAEFHEAELLRTYKSVHGRLPGIVGRDDEWVRGNKHTPRKRGPFSDLVWCDWHLLEPRTIRLVPVGSGVYRVRAE